MRDLTTLKATGQQRVAVLVAYIGEVLAGHADARGPGLLQTIHKIPFLFQDKLAFHVVRLFCVLLAELGLEENLKKVPLVALNAGHILRISLRLI